MHQHFVHQLLQHKMQQLVQQIAQHSARGIAVNPWELCAFRWAE
jgi:hypothetical protein